MKTCRHCRKNSANRPRGLCFSCYADLGVRNLYPLPPKRGDCRHCHKGNACRPRGLCSTCFNNHDLRDDYPRSKYGPNLDDFNGGYTPPDEPTDARPGSAAKKAVLAERVAAGRSLHHKEDVGFAGEVR